MTFDRLFVILLDGPKYSICITSWVKFPNNLKTYCVSLKIYDHLSEMNSQDDTNTKFFIGSFVLLK